MSNTAVTDAMDTFGRIRDALQDARADSIIEYTQSLRVEPVTLLDSSLRHQTYITDILQSMVSIFSGYYLQAVALSCNVGNIDTLRLLDKLNPNRDPINAAGTGASRILKHVVEGYSKGLPFNSGLEDRWDNVSSGTSMSTGKDVVKNIESSANLSVGKMLEVTITSDGHSAMVPVSVRLAVKVIDGGALVSMYGSPSQARSARERYHGWRSGELDFVRDIIMCQDIIDNYKKTALADKDGKLASMVNRTNRNRISAAVSGNFSVANASSIVIVSQQTASQIERAISGRLSNFRVREKLFKATYTMLFVVIDTQWEQAIMYHRSIQDTTDLSIKEFKAVSKGTGPDVSEILSAYRAGSAPSL